MLTVEQLAHATGSTLQNATIFLPNVIATLDQFQISTPIRQLCFLAQVGHESGGLFYTEELAAGDAYEGRTDLGNTQPGDGKKYKGRGLIQITGRANYQAMSAFFGVDFTNNPTSLAGKNVKVCTPDQLKFASLSAGWFWNTHQLNAISDRMDINSTLEDGPNMDAFISITKKINGGTNGLQDRVARYNNGRSFFLTA